MTFGAEHITVRFGDVHALQDVTLDVPTGAVTAVVGGDGAGKSTLMRCLVGKVVPEQGSLRRPPKQQVGYLPSGSGSWRDLTVDENVEFVGRVYRLSRSALDGRRSELLRAAGLLDVGNRLVRNLSGGMRQKLGFVLAMLHRPALVVLDEPSTGVDPVSRVELWRMIAETAADGAAVVMSTTYVDEAERASAVLVLDEGRAALSGRPDEVIAAIPGRVVQVAHPADRRHAWRRGRSFHEWLPDGSPARGNPVLPDLEDTIVAEMLYAREVSR